MLPVQIVSYLCFHTWCEFGWDWDASCASRVVQSTPNAFPHTIVLQGAFLTVPTRGQTLCQNNRQLIGMSLIGLAQQAKKIAINRT